MSTINVTYKCIDGAHFFVTTDKEAAGLCVAHTDFDTAFNEVAFQLNALFKFNHGIECNFQPRIPLAAFKKTIEAQQLVTKGADPTDTLMAALIQPWMAEQVGGH